MRRRPQLVVFAKAPRLGRVKRRLAAQAGPVAAWRFYRGTTAALLARVGRDRRWRCTLFVTPDRFAARGRFWPATVARAAQGGGDLGACMMRAFRRLPPGPAVIVGSDVPELGRDQVARAFALLGRHDVVFGPTRDGGYWLVGLRHPRRHPDLFRGVRWSTAHALADTRANLGAHRSVAWLETLEDVDDVAALARWRGRLRRSGFPDAPGAVASARPGCRA